jgi:hypothetical protein
MTVQPDVLELVRVLTEEGFGIVAGDLLAEISGRSDIDGDFDEEIDLGEKKGSATQRLADDEQLGEALRIIRMRLVDPARHLAEGERIAGSIADSSPALIRFTRGDGSERGDSRTRAEAGDSAVAEKLEETLWRIAAARPPSIA